MVLFRIAEVGISAIRVYCMGCPFVDTLRVFALELFQFDVADARGAFLRFGPQSGNLPSVVRGIKSAVTKYAIEHDIPFAWQSRYHDHIIRNQLEMNRIADYIENNPLRWELDRFYKKR